MSDDAVTDGDFDLAVNIDEKIKIYSKKLPILENDTHDSIEYVKQTNKKKKKKFNFWKLLEND